LLSLFTAFSGEEELQFAYVAERNPSEVVGSGHGSRGLGRFSERFCSFELGG
jgi:hypothetical protein